MTHGTDRRAAIAPLHATAGLLAPGSSLIPAFPGLRWPSGEKRDFARRSQWRDRVGFTPTSRTVDVADRSQSYDTPSLTIGVSSAASRGQIVESGRLQRLARFGGDVAFGLVAKAAAHSREQNQKSWSW